MKTNYYQCIILSALIFLLVSSCTGDSKRNVIKRNTHVGCGQNCYVIHYHKEQMNDEKLKEIIEATEFSFKRFSLFFPDLHQRLNLTLSSGAKSDSSSDNIQRTTNCKADTCSNPDIQFAWLISPTNMFNNLITTNMYLIPELGILLEKNESMVRVNILSDSVNAPVNNGFHDEDQLLSINDTPIASISEFGNVYALIPEGANILFNVLRKGNVNKDTISVFIEKKPKKEKNSWSIDDEMDQTILSHEIAHVLFTGYANSKMGNKNNPNKGKKQPGRHSGYSSIPAWFNEAIAILAEDQEYQNLRLHKMKQKIENKIPLSQFLSMIHPLEKGHEKLTTKDTEEIKDIGSLFKMITSKIEETSSESAEDVFYPQVCSFINFLIDKEGDKIVMEIAEGFINRMSMTQILQQHVKNIPSDLTKLEKEWVKWVEKQ